MTASTKARQVSATWVIVADRRMARMFKRDDADSELRELETLTCDRGTAKQSDTVSDRQGYFRGNKSGLEAGDSQTDFAHKTADELASRLIATLEAGRAANQFGTLIIFAAPLFLGVLRKKMSAPLAKLVTLEIDKDYVNDSLEEIDQRLAELS